MIKSNLVVQILPSRVHLVSLRFVLVLSAHRDSMSHNPPLFERISELQCQRLHCHQGQAQSRHSQDKGFTSKTTKVNMSQSTNKISPMWQRSFKSKMLRRLSQDSNPKTKWSTIAWTLPLITEKKYTLTIKTSQNYLHFSQRIKLKIVNLKKQTLTFPHRSLLILTQTSSNSPSPKSTSSIKSSKASIHSHQTKQGIQNQEILPNKQ